MISRHVRGGFVLRRSELIYPTRITPGSSTVQAASLLARRRHVVTSAGAAAHWRRQPRLSNTLDQRRLATAVDSRPYALSGPSLGAALSPDLPTNDLCFFNTPGALTRVPEAPLAVQGKFRMNPNGIPGTVEEMLQVFDACIQVHKLDRAAAVLKRLEALDFLPPGQLILLHNTYLRTCLQRIRATSNIKEAEPLHQWYQIRIARPRLPLTAETIACMLKASLLSERGSRLHRLVTRYMNMAPGEDGLRVLSMADILSDQDLAVITEICPTYNFTAGSSDDAYVELSSDPEAADSKADAANTNAPGQPQSIPDLVPTPQKGLGLASLKQGLSLLAELQEVDAARLTQEDRTKIQLQLEKDAVTSAIDKWRSEHEKLQKMGLATAIYERSVSQNVAFWLADMEARIKEELALVEESEEREEKTEVDFARCVYGPILAQSEPARLATVTILTAINLTAMASAEKGIPVSRLSKAISDVVQEDILLQRKDKEKAARKARTSRKISQRPTSQLNPSGRAFLHKGTRAAGRVATGTGLKQSTNLPPESLSDRQAIETALEKPWAISIRFQVGAILTKILLEMCSIQVACKDPKTGKTLVQAQPAFSHRHVPRKGKKVGVIQPNDGLTELLKKEPMGDQMAKHLPMIVEPKRWDGFNSGGLLETKVNMVRLKTGDDEQRLYAEAALKNGDLKRLCDGLDVLGRTPWRINQEVLGVMVEGWNSGDEIANMPPINPDLPSPPEPETDDPLDKFLWIRALKKVENERQALHSQRCHMNLQLEIARVFRNQTLYFPHNVDYRGRAYPIPTYLNHMGADHMRAILKFAEPKRLGARGLRWLRIHLANLYGLDKASFDDREAFAKDNMDKIRESAENPLKGSRWWLQAEDPWQCLATCFELKAAMELENPEDYLCSLPVHQDGTCNGLQHYAALGGDSWGAKQVNLEPGSKPADVYSAVADLVKESIAADAKEGNPFGKAMDGKITRKVVKQTVMTNVYGVTFAGAKKQVAKQIDALYPNIAAETGVSVILLSTYVAKFVFQALSSMFRGAHDIQYWLGESGGRVCRAITASQLDEITRTYKVSEAEAEKETKPSRGRPKKGTEAVAKKPVRTVTSGHGGLKGFAELSQYFKSTVVWTTPFRMPVAQPYRVASTKEVRTCLQTLVCPVHDQTDPVNRRKQLQGFPPNFIHSLDASHMLLSALKCHEQGLEFAAVHDSFWTHACDIDKMNGILRDSFIQIHEEDVIGRLADEFSIRHRGSIYLANIDADSPVAKKIKELRKNSNLTPKEELLLEHKRNTLRLSSNPWDQEAAKNIITPASVYENMKAEEADLEIKAEVDEIALGDIPESEPDLVDSATAEKVLAQRELSNPSQSPNINPATGETMGNFETLLVKGRNYTNQPKVDHLQLWLPLTTPAIPKKGDFDVRRLRDSQYFFS